MSLLKQSTARNRLFVLVSSTDHIAVKTAAAPVVNISKNGGAFAAAAGAVTEIANGFYQVALTTADTGTLGDLAFHITGTGADPTQFVDQVVAFDPADAVALGLSRIDAAVSSRATPAQVLATPTNLLATDGTGRVTVGTNADKTGYTASTVTDKTGYSLSAAGVQAIWDALTSALTTVGSIGARLATNIDAAISSRMATFAYTAPDNTSIGTILGRTDVATSTRLATSGYTAPPTAAQVSTQVWTEPIPGSFAAGSAGARLNSASAAGDPWATPVPGVYGAGTAGNILGSRLDVAVSSRASGAVGGVVGSGSKSVPITVTRPDGVTPVEGVAVWVTSDLAGTNAVAGTLYTDTLGRINTTVGFMLDPGTYYLWRQHGAWNFTNPVSVVVS